MQRLHSYNFSVFSSPRSCIRNELHVILQKNRWSYVDVVGATRTRTSSRPSNDSGHGHQRPSGRSFATAAASHAQTRFSARQTYYDVLEITDRQCDKQEIKRQFRRLAKQYHPDHLQLETKEEEEAALLKFREIREAYEILGNKWKRGLYDVDLRNATAVAVDVDEESWTDHWKNESAEERDARRGRYRRYARGERIDMPPRLINLPAPAMYLGGATISFLVWQGCVAVPETEGFSAEETFADPEMDMSASSLVFAWYNPVEDVWERVLDPSGREILPRPALQTEAEQRQELALASASKDKEQGDHVEDVVEEAEALYTTGPELSRMRSFVPPPEVLYDLYPRIKKEKRPKNWPESELPVLLMPRCRTRYWPRVKLVFGGGCSLGEIQGGAPEKHGRERMSDPPRPRWIYE